MRWQVRARAPDWLQQSSREKDAPSAISTGVKNLWKANSVYRLSFFGTSGYCRTGLSACPCLPRALLRNTRPSHRRSQTARDCRRLKRRGQAKSARRTCRAFTSRAQFFHKGDFLARCPPRADSKGNFAEILQRKDSLERNCTRTT